MARRIEGQINRDWQFGFVSWNYMFRSAVNLSRTWFAYENRVSNGETMEKLTPNDLEKGAIQICKALWDEYRDVDGKVRKVGGDMTKVRYVPGLSAAAKRLLQNIEHTTRKLPGTQETRRQMRFDTHANRIRYGVPIFVTFSPDEAHNLLMIRLSRTRRKDLVFAKNADPVGQSFCGRRVPSITTDTSDEIVWQVPVEAMQWKAAQLPSYDERRAILANDALAMAGFSILHSVSQHVLATGLTTQTTGSVTPNEQGALLGLEHSLYSLARMGGPAIGTALFAFKGVMLLEGACGSIDVLTVLFLFPENILY